MKIRSDTLPAYVRIRQQVLGQIARVDGEYEKLPSVQELCDIHQASRPTVIKALRQLREDGMIIARRGLGMFANPRALDKRYGHDVGKPKGVVGVLAGAGTHSYYATYNLNLLNGLSSVLANGGYHLQFVNLVHRGADALDELRLLKLNGLLWLWTGDAALPTINAIDASDIPLVTVAHHEKYYSKNFVGMSFRDNGHFSAEHLLELGHRDIVYLCLPVIIVVGWNWKECGRRLLIAAWRRNSSASFHAEMIRQQSWRRCSTCASLLRLSYRPRNIITNSWTSSHSTALPFPVTAQLLPTRNS